MAAAAAIALAWAALTLLSGGLTLRLGALAIVSRQPQRPLFAGALLLIVAAALLGSTAIGEIGRIFAGRPGRRAARVAVLAALSVLVLSLAWNTRAAGGSDSSCYLLQAQAFAAGHATLRAVTEVPLGTSPAVLAPIGFLASPRPPFAPVPICAPGLALVMTPAFLLSPAAPFVVVPLFAAFAVWLTFLLGRQLGDPLVGACAAVLLGCSPIFLYQSVQPMSDVPATTAWLAALTFCVRGDRRGAMAGGLFASLAVLMRPNLALLVAALPLLLTKSVKRGQSPFPALGKGDNRLFNGDCPLFRLAWFLAAAVPGAIAMLALNRARYGSPFASGYGSTDVLFAVSHVAPNLARYPRWLLETHTPFVLLAAIAPWLLWRAGRGRLALVGTVAVAATFATYLAYTVFDDWWYIRFLLPALPILLVFAVLVLRRVAPPAIAVAICVTLAGWYAHQARERHVFELQALESRFPVTGGYAARALPQSAVVFAGQQGGSVRYHGGRETLAWDAVPPGELDTLIASLRAQGKAPFIALEDAEVPRFRERFQAQAAGQLDWPPAVEVHTPVRVRIFDPGRRVGYLEGGKVETAHIWR